MAKTLQQIKDEHARELGYADYEDLFSEGVHTGVQACCDLIAIKWANQKLEEAVEKTNLEFGLRKNSAFAIISKQSILNLREEV